MSATGRIHAVITADVIDSRKWSRFTALRNAKLRQASAAHTRQGVVRGKYTITTWDEFQNILRDFRDLPRLLFDLRRIFQPLQLRIGVGVGTLNRPVSDPINEAGGEAFVMAREALELSKEGSGEKFDRITYVRSTSAGFQEVGNLFFGLQDSLTGAITERQWGTINAYVPSCKQEVAARKLGVGKSTISRNLQRARYWQIEASIESMRRVIEAQLHENVQLGRS